MRRLIFIFGLLDLSIVAIYPVKIPYYLRGIKDEKMTSTHFEK